MLLELSNLSIEFGGLKALDSINLTVFEAEILSLIGPNGAGKTTVFNIVTGIYKPSSGEIRFKGESILSKPPYMRTRLGISRTFQNIRLFKQLTVTENLMLAMHPLRNINALQSILRLPAFFKERREIIKKAEGFLEYVDLSSSSGELAGNLPYGKQRELEILRAISTGAALLLLDEPAAGMNPQETLKLMKFIKRLRDDMKKAILLIEHDMTLVMGISDRVAALDYGKLLTVGTPSEIQNNQDVIEAYLGKVEDAHSEEC